MDATINPDTYPPPDHYPVADFTVFPETGKPGEARSFAAFAAFRVREGSGQYGINEVCLHVHKPETLDKIAAAATKAAAELRTALRKPEPVTVTDDAEADMGRDINDPSITPTLAEALADPAGFVAGMTETVLTQEQMEVIAGRR